MAKSKSPWVASKSPHPVRSAGRQGLTSVGLGAVVGDGQAAPLVGGGDEAEEELGAGVVQGREAQLVDDDEVVLEQTGDDAADRVVGHAAVEGLDQVRGGEVADAAADLDGAQR